jgi:drug/metabolite transporter (DMT)-like permease
VAFLGYYWLLKRAKAITVSQIAFITPAIALILGYFLKSEIFTILMAFGAVMILAGVFLVIRQR